PRVGQSHSGTAYHRPMPQSSDVFESVDPGYPQSQHKCPGCPAPTLISDPIADYLGSLSSGFGLHSTDKPIIYPMTSSSSASGISSLRPTSGMNNESGSGGSGDDGRGGSGGDGRGNDAGMGGGNGDEALNLPMVALKPRGAHTWLGVPNR
ncbi:hypothetical protein Tco_1542634, partial [Tanacetum coccineum]